MTKLIDNAATTKQAWVRPEVRAISAGSAEANPGSRDDGGSTQSS